MLYKLAWKSFKRQARNYIVYFLCMAMAAMVYYSFNTITYDRHLLRLTNQDVRIESFLNMGSFVIVLIILFFMLGAHHFFLSKRSKEIGLYHLLGLRKLEITQLFFIENMVLGSISLILGILMGIVFSKFFSMILIKAMDLDTHSSFFISLPSFLSTAVVFLVLLLIVSVRGIWLVYHYQLIQLFPVEERRNRDQVRKHDLPVVSGIAGLVLLGLGYSLAAMIQLFIQKLMARMDSISAFLVAICCIFVLCVAGSYLFFARSSKLLYGLLSRCKKNLYKDLHAVALGNLQLHVAKNWRMLASISIILGGSLTAIAAMTTIATFLLHSVNITDPVSFQLAEEQVADFKEILNQEEGQLVNQVTLDYKALGVAVTTTFANEEPFQEVAISNVLSYSNYRSYQKINTYLPNISVPKSNEVIMVDALSNMLPNLVRYKREVYLPNRKVNLKERVPSFLGSNDLRYGTSDYVFIVNDRLFRELEGVDYQVEAVNVTVPDKESFSQRLNESLDQAWGAPLYAHYTIQHNSLVGEIGAAPISEEQALTSSKLNWSSRYPTFRAVRRQVGVFVYVAVFAGMVALISTASILMLRQFSEADSEKANYRLLKKIGISDKKIVKLIYIQNAFVFFPPMLLGVLHAFFAIHIFSQLVTNKDYWLSYLFCGLLVLVYVVFYAGTTAVYQRIIESGE